LRASITASAGHPVDKGEFIAARRAYYEMAG
jgi:hypothetical protein